MPTRPTMARSAAAATALAAAMVLVLGACGSSSSKSSGKSTTSSSTTTSTTAPTSTSAGSANPLASAPPPGASFPNTISFVKLPGAGGLILVGPKGHSLYVFDRDQGTTSACTGPCHTIWPPLTASGTPTVAKGLDASKAGTASGQVTYNGHLLYYFSGDQAPGDTNGVNIPMWHVVSPLGTAMAAR